MTPRAKQILRDGIAIYNAVPNKYEYIKMVQDNLSTHYNGIKTIGIGLDVDKVIAGEIFLRIFNK